MTQENQLARRKRLRPLASTRKTQCVVIETGIARVTPPGRERSILRVSAGRPGEDELLFKVRGTQGARQARRGAVKLARITRA